MGLGLCEEDFVKVTQLCGCVKFLSRGEISWSVNLSVLTQQRCCFLVSEEGSIK